MCQRFFHLVDQDQAQIAFAQCRQGVIDRGKLALDVHHAARPRRILQAFTQQPDDLAVGAAALTGVLIQHDMIKRSAEDAGLLADILVATVART